MPKYSREELLERIVDTLLTGGLVEASLRPLAKAAGTSDRMLLYYFKDKDTLLSEAFSVLAARILSQLEADFPTGSTAAAGDLLRHLGQATRGEQMAPAMRLWIEITAAASRGIEPHKSVGAAILNGFLHWIEVRLPVDFPGDRPASAAAILAAVDGAAILDILGRPDAATKSLEEAARRFD
ncbi:MAG: TetR/AcrR family transcriptional regulator [Pseudomonadota bacterium]